MLTVIRSAISCGLHLIGGETQYTSPEVFVKDFFTHKNRNLDGFTQFVFSHKLGPQDQIVFEKSGHFSKRISDTCMGDRIEALIKEHNLGFIVRSEPAGNPIHPAADHQICVWVWTIPDHSICQNYLHGLKEKKDA